MNEKEARNGPFYFKKFYFASCDKSSPHLVLHKFLRPDMDAGLEISSFRFQKLYVEQYENCTSMHKDCDSHCDQI